MFKPQFLQPEPSDWFNYTTVRAPEDSIYHVIVHRDTGVALTSPYQGYLIEGFLAKKHLALFIKTKADVYRFFAFCHDNYQKRSLWPTSGEPRALTAQNRIEAEDGDYASSLDTMLDAIVLGKNTCSSLFKTFGFEFTEEFEKLHGRDGLKKLAEYPATGYPVVRKRVPTDLAKKALAKWFTIHQCQPTDFVYNRHLKAYRSAKRPLATFYVSFFNNRGNVVNVENQKVFLFEEHKLPKPYLKKGHRFTSFREPGIWTVTSVHPHHSTNQSIIAKNAQGQTTLFYLWSPRTYMFAGSNGGICGFSQALHRAA